MMALKPEERPTAAEMAGFVAKNGIECPRCGCRDFRVVKTRPGEHLIARRRECRHCGYRVTTVET